MHSLAVPSSSGLQVPLGSSCSISRRGQIMCQAQAQQQNQARPVFIEDKGTGTFLDWAQTQGILLLHPQEHPVLPFE